MTNPANINLIALDVDGVLTDGTIRIDDNAVETKRFYVRDGLALAAWQKLGFKVAIVTKRSGKALEHRMRELSIDLVIQGANDKSEALDRLVRETGIPAERTAFLGDDWPDLAILRRVGYPMAVADAEPAVLALATYVTTRAGGHGAVRDAVEHILRAKGMMDDAIALYDVHHNGADQRSRTESA